jgi:hypothetical protein
MLFPGISISKHDKRFSKSHSRKLNNWQKMCRENLGSQQYHHLEPTKPILLHISPTILLYVKKQKSICNRVLYFSKIIIHSHTETHPFYAFIFSLHFPCLFWVTIHRNRMGPLAMHSQELITPLCSPCHSVDHIAALYHCSHVWSISIKNSNK